MKETYLAPFSETVRILPEGLIATSEKTSGGATPEPITWYDETE